MSIIYSIYKATNLINGKAYIGFDSNWPSRMHAHEKMAIHRKSKQIFHKAIAKHKFENFSWEILYTSDDWKWTINVMERYFIIKHNTFYQTGHGYNMTFGGEGIIGYKHTPETIKKIREIASNPTLEQRAKISAAGIGRIPWNKGIPSFQKGIKRSPETIAKMSKAAIGKSRSVTEETKIKISKANKGKPKPPRSQEHINNMSKAKKGFVWVKNSLEERQVSKDVAEILILQGYEYGKLPRTNPTIFKDPEERKRNISAAKKGRTTNQSAIMGTRFAAMTEEEFQTYLSDKSKYRITSFINLRNKYIQLNQ